MSDLNGGLADDVAEILDGFTEIGTEAVPDAFVDFVHDQIGARPSPAPLIADPVLGALAHVSEQLDEVLTLLRGGNRE